ncbi:MAG: ABC transporter [Alphaproteobacteria bacterium HGW-Alphaproteobacteria-6]|nr:MAG: ABC transporter [Alphaproteobacteria bacterium HGW-Alphaproteobacteria-6]
MANDLSRRGLLAALAAGGAGLILPRPALALNTADARGLIGALVGDINGVINSGRSERAMFTEFERIFVRYADVRYIAQSALGPAGRSIGKAEMGAFEKAFQGYISRKYGRRFREFIGGEIEVTGARPLKSFYEVTSVAHLKGQSPFEVRWHVFDKSGRDLFFNLIIEGINMLAAERTEIGAMLDRQRGNVSALTAELARL